eukprot:gene4348-3162_t
MTDASPVNYYLLFDRSDEFETQDKILYALSDEHDTVRQSSSNCVLEDALSRKVLIRSLAELKRMMGEPGYVASPVSGKSFMDEAGSDAVSCTSRDTSMHAGPVESIDKSPWEVTADSNSEWNMPLEILYQNYHVHVVIDFARAFDVSRNGNIFYDRVPDVVHSLMTALHATLDQRQQDTENITAWLSSTSLGGYKPEEILKQVWNPHVLLSITLINVPLLADGVVRPSQSRFLRRYNRAAKRDLVPPDAKVFSTLCRDASNVNIIPILSKAETHDLLDDEEFIQRLEETLAAYEKAARKKGISSKNSLSLESSVEYLVRSAPNTSKYCESIVLVANVNTCTCSSSISFLEGMVRRKNIILSIVTLNRVHALDSPPLSSLMQFVSRLGGFIVSIDFWRAFAQPHLNREWAEKFEGSRCLLQQLLVQLVNRFPHRPRDSFLRFRDEGVVLYDESNGLPTKACTGKDTALAVLQSIAVARFNENWSVLMQNSSEAGDARLLARYTHYFHQGALTLEYELTITPHSFSRSVSIHGTRTLVDQFHRVDVEKLNERGRISGVASGASHVENFRTHLHEDLQGEELMLQMILETSYAKQMRDFSSSKGVLYKWLNFSAVRSIAVFYDISNNKDYSQMPVRGRSSLASSPVVQAIISIMSRNHYIPVSGEEGPVFIRLRKGFHPYLVQFFPIACGGGYVDYPAGCFECRISFFLSGWRKRAEEVRHLISILNEKGDIKGLTLKASSHKDSQSALGVMLALMSPRYELPTVQLSKPLSLLEEEEGPQMFIPYPVHPFALKRAFTFHWNFPAEDLNLPKSFFFAMLRRQQQSFDCLISLGSSLCATMQWKRSNEDHGSVVDFIDARGSAGVRITRVVTGMTVWEESGAEWVAKRSPHAVWCDAEQDEKIFSALNTFFRMVYSGSSAPLERGPSGSRRPHIHVEPLLPYLSTEEDKVALPSPASLGGEGVRQLRQCLNGYMVNVGSSQIVDISLFMKSFVRILENGGNFSKVVVSTKVGTSSNPWQSGCIIFAFMISHHGDAVEKSQHAVEVTLVWMNFERLSQEITSRYHVETTHRTRMERPAPLADSKILHELRLDLMVRASTHSTSRLLQFIADEYNRDPPDEPPPLSNNVVKDLERVAVGLGIYVKEIDITPVLHVVESVPSADGRGEADLQDVLSSVLRRFCRFYNPLSSLAFPSEDALRLPDGSSDAQAEVPVLMACGVVLPQMEDGFWVRGSQPADSANGSQRKWGSGRKGANMNALLRIFMISSMVKEVQRRREPTGMQDGKSSGVSLLLKDTPPKQGFLSGKLNFPTLDVLYKGVVADKLERLVELVSNEMMRFCLESTFRHPAYLRLRQVVEAPGRGSAEAGHVKRHYPLLSQRGREVCSQLAQVASCPELRALLHRVVGPSLFACSSRKEKSEIFSTCEAPLKDLNGIFQQCAEQDAVAILPAQFSSKIPTDSYKQQFIFVPNADTLAHTWVLVDVKFPENAGSVHISWCQWDEKSDAETTEVVMALCAYVKGKITQVYQLRLLKELRSSQMSSGELMPDRWGNQLVQGARERQLQMQQRGSARRAVAATLAPLQLDGTTILELPLYLQAAQQGPRSLVPLFNQPQCFIVADDVVEGIFHWLRLVFISDSDVVSPMEPSPPLSSTDRCEKLIVQLYSAVDNPVVQRPLKKLRNTCYSLAVQELQSQLNYADKLTFNDILFLQNRSMTSYSISYGGDEEGSNGIPQQTFDTDGTLILALVILHLRESNYKYLSLADAAYSTTSKFVEYYSLGDKQLHESKNEKKKVWRFVKLFESVIDVLVSCTVFLDEEKKSVMLQPYLTKQPLESYRGSENIQNQLAQLEGYTSNAAVQFEFVSRARQEQKINIGELREKMVSLQSISERITCKESSMLSFQQMPLADISTATLPYLVERLCGAVAGLSPCCFQYAGTDTLQKYGAGGSDQDPLPLPLPTVVTSFNWSWFESIQNHPLADCMEFLIVCGFNVVLEDGSSATPCRVVPHVVPDISLDWAKADESKEGMLKALGLATRMDAHVIIKVDMCREVSSITVFNLRDAEALLHMISRIGCEMSRKSKLLQNVLLQRLGIMPRESPFSENDLAENCCGDVSNVIQDRKLILDSQNYRRPAKTLRFPPRSPSCGLTDEESRFIVMVEGLQNRGLVVNHIFHVDDGVKVLFDECPDLSVDQCLKLVSKTFLLRNYLKSDEASKLKPRITVLPEQSVGPYTIGGFRRPAKPRAQNCRIVYLQKGWTAGALIACIYHRHIFTSHVIIEAQNARSSVQLLLSQCQRLLERGKDHLELAKAIIHLQSKSKQILGARVPDFLLFHEGASPADDVLDPNLPVRSDKNVKHSMAVDTVLRSFTSHLLSVFPTARLIDLDPSSEQVLSDPVLVQRLRCRYGKVYSKAEERMVRFCPHLCYAVIPLSHLFWPMCSGSGTGLNGPPPVTSCGLFIVEVGFQVAHYALDIFAIKGESIPPSIVARLAADLRQQLGFEATLYDHQVQQVLQQLRHNAPALPGHQSMAQAVSTLTVHFPSPPHGARTAASSYLIRSALLPRAAPGPSEEDWLPLLPGKEEGLLTAAVGQKVYRFSGIATWIRTKPRDGDPTQTEKKLRLYILLEPLDHAVGPLSVEDLHSFLRTAKRRLVRLLDRATHQERLDSAWQKFVTLPPQGGLVGLPLLQNPDEYHLLVQDSVKIFLPNALQKIRTLAECADWTVPPMLYLRCVAEQLFPLHVLHAVGKPSRPSEGGGGGVVSDVWATLEQQASLSRESVSDDGSAREGRRESLVRLVFTIAALDDPNRLLSVEGWCHRSGTEEGFAIEVEEVSIIRRVTPGTPAGAGLHFRVDMREPLTPAEHALVSVFVEVLTHAMFHATLQRLPSLGPLFEQSL